MSLAQRQGTLWGWSVAAAMAAGALLRAWFIWRFAHISADSLMYGDIAQNLSKYGVYGITETTHGLLHIRPTLIRLPGYPLFLLACFRVFGMGRFGAVLGVQVALDLWTCLLLGGLARRMLSRQAGVAGVWLGALCPFTATYVATPLTETATLWCMAAAFYGFKRWQQEGAGLNRWCGVLGFALAWAVLLRPEQGMLAVAVVGGMLFASANKETFPGDLSFPKRTRVRLSRAAPVLLVCLLTVLPLAPWAARNWQTFHTLQPLAPRYANDPGERVPFGFQRWFRTWAIDFASTDQVYWPYDGDQISVADLPNRAFDSEAQYTQTAALLAEYNQTTTASPALDALFAAIAADRVKADPLRYYLGLPIARVVNMALRPRVDMLPIPLDWWRWREHPRTTIVAWGLAVLNLVYFALAAVTLGRRGAWQQDAALVSIMLGTVLLRCLLLLTIDNSETRYTLEFYPVLIALGSLCFYRRTASLSHPSPAL